MSCSGWSVGRADHGQRIGAGADRWPGLEDLLRAFGRSFADHAHYADLLLDRQPDPAVTRRLRAAMAELTARAVAAGTVSSSVTTADVIALISSMRGLVKRDQGRADGGLAAVPRHSPGGDAVGGWVCWVCRVFWVGCTVTWRAVPAVVGGFVVSLVIAVVVICRGAGRRDSAGTDRLLRWWAGGCLRAAGARVVVHGLIALKRPGPCVVVANHQSGLDPVTQIKALPLSLRILAMTGAVPDRRARAGACGTSG